ncbi:MAG: RNA 2',3'-cyclic phosphodiesterase [Acidimicrobiia bacterium]|nr:RNA 2',3'-cyclic phosphodiesterase [Acidimicrobiia bacterium]MYH55887.1 RNA 2',3'-cyclic phosphodiesterase [Acidimicrobiia bacterium]
MDSLPLSRYFLALSLPPEIRLAVDDWRAGLELPGRPVPPEKLHITLRFIGSADRIGIERIMAALSTVSPGSGFSYRIGGLGAFPKPRKATVAWAGLEDRGELSRLAGIADEAAAAAGFGYEERPFRAHLTLARIRPPSDLRRVIAGARPAGFSVSAQEVILYLSRTEGSRTTYHPLERFPLK